MYRCVRVCVCVGLIYISFKRNPGLTTTAAAMPPCERDTQAKARRHYAGRALPDVCCLQLERDDKSVTHNRPLSAVCDFSVPQERLPNCRCRPQLYPYPHLSLCRCRCRSPGMVVFQYPYLLLDCASLCVRVCVCVRQLVSVALYLQLYLCACICSSVCVCVWLYLYLAAGSSSYSLLAPLLLLLLLPEYLYLWRVIVVRCRRCHRNAAVAVAFAFIAVVVVIVVHRIVGSSVTRPLFDVFFVRSVVRARSLRDSTLSLVISIARPSSVGSVAIRIWISGSITSTSSSSSSS